MLFGTQIEKSQENLHYSYFYALKYTNLELLPIIYMHAKDKNDQSLPRKCTVLKILAWVMFMNQYILTCICVKGMWKDYRVDAT